MTTRDFLDLEAAKERHDSWFARHNQELDEIREGVARDRATIAEIRKGHEDLLALAVDHENLILANQRRIKEREEWEAKMDAIAERIQLNLQEATDKLNALIHWDMQRHGYPEGGNPPTE